MKSQNVFRVLFGIACVLTLMLLPGSAFAQKPIPIGVIPQHEQVYALDTGTHDGAPLGTERRRNRRRAKAAFEQVIQVPDAQWLRLHFSASALGASSFIRLTSLKDNQVQFLDATSIAEWDSFSATFNGDAVRLELIARPGDAQVFVRVDRLIVGEKFVKGRKPNAPEEEVCTGTDNREASKDKRVGRLRLGGIPSSGYCTGWLVSNGAILTAQHCNPDTAGTLIEFNVPASDSNGDVNNADVKDQYPIDTARILSSGSEATGNDWAVLRPNPNSNTRRLPHQVQDASFRMRNVYITGYNNSATITQTGYGDAAGTARLTQQRSIGTPLESVATAEGVELTYSGYSTGGTSGGPIEMFVQPAPIPVWWTAVAIGVHKGCRYDSKTGALISLIGTSFDNDGLEAAIQTFPGNRTTYVDSVPWLYPGVGDPEPQNGMVFSPFRTVADGVNSVEAGRVLSIVKGNYNERLTITKKMRIEAPAGKVIIGAAP